MTEADIVAAISPLFGGRVSSLVAPQNTDQPFCVYQHISGVPVPTLCGTGGRFNARIQFHVWARSIALSGGTFQAMSLIRQIEAIVTAPPFRATPLSQPTTMYDENVRLFGAHQDFSFWF